MTLQQTMLPDYSILTEAFFNMTIHFHSNIIFSGWLVKIETNIDDKSIDWYLQQDTTPSGETPQ